MKDKFYRFMIKVIYCASIHNHLTTARHWNDLKEMTIVKCMFYRKKKVHLCHMYVMYNIPKFILKWCELSPVRNRKLKKRAGNSRQVRMQLNPAPTRLCHISYHHGGKGYPCLMGTGLTCFWMHYTLIQNARSGLLIVFDIWMLETGQLCLIFICKSQFLL